MLKKLNLKGEQNVVQMILVGLLIVAAFFIGSLWTKVQNLEGSGLTDTGTPTAVNNGQPQVPQQPPQPQVGDVAPVTAEDHVKGNRNSKLALIEYSDFDCPFCKRFHPTAQQMLSEYGDQIMWVYRHFPLDSLHPDAREKSEASECAYQLGGETAFWQFADQLLDQADTTGVDGMSALADQFGLNTADFDACMNAGNGADAVESDYQSGLKAGITGTPGNIILNTQTGEAELIPGAVPFSTLKQTIDSILAK